MANTDKRVGPQYSMKIAFKKDITSYLATMTLQIVYFKWSLS